MAHLLEHMMFRGSEQVGPGEFAALVQLAGGFLNATTSTDRTNFYEALPKNQLALGLFLEADRMKSLRIDDRDFFREREVVMQERQFRIENRAYGRTDEAIQTLSYPGSSPHATIGTKADLARLTPGQARTFYHKRYVPENAVLTLVGDFDPNAALKLIHQYFDPIPAGAHPLHIHDLVDGPDSAVADSPTSSYQSIEDPFCVDPRLDVVFPAPPANTPAWYALAVAGDVLADGKSSPLYRRLVTDTSLIDSVTWIIQQKPVPSVGRFTMSAQTAEDLQKAQTILFEEINRFETSPIAEEDIARVSRSFIRDTSERYETTVNRALVFSEFAILYKDPGLINAFPLRLTTQKQQQLQAAARLYWRPLASHVIMTSCHSRKENR
jgi:predicted Zn-dependent peptidase